MFGPFAAASKKIYIFLRRLEKCFSKWRIEPNPYETLVLFRISRSSQNSRQAYQDVHAYFWNVQIHLASQAIYLGVTLISELDPQNNFLLKTNKNEVKSTKVNRKLFFTRTKRTSDLFSTIAQQPS